MDQNTNMNGYVCGAYVQHRTGTDVYIWLSSGGGRSVWTVERCQQWDNINYTAHDFSFIGLQLTSTHNYGKLTGENKTTCTYFI